jgi:hypothetical protein
MFRATMKAAIGILSLLLSLPLFGAEMRFKTMRLPPNVDVQIGGSTARISGGQAGIATIWNCSCTKGEAAFRTAREFSPATREPQTPVKPPVSFPSM